MISAIKATVTTPQAIRRYSSGPVRSDSKRSITLPPWEPVDARYGNRQGEFERSIPPRKANASVIRRGNPAVGQKGSIEAPHARPVALINSLLSNNYEIPPLATESYGQASEQARTCSLGLADLNPSYLSEFRASVLVCVRPGFLRSGNSPCTGP